MRGKSFRHLCKFFAGAIAVLGICLFGCIGVQADTLPDEVDVVWGTEYYQFWSKNTDHLNCYNKIEVEKQGYIKFKSTKPLDSEGEFGGLKIGFYNEDGDAIWYHQTRSEEENDARTYYQYRIGVEPGTYYCNFRPSFYVTSGLIEVTYSFELEENKYCETEPNNRTVDADVLKMNRMYEGYYGTTQDSNDFFKFTAAAGRDYRIYVDWPNGDDTSIVDLMYPSGDDRSLMHYMDNVDNEGRAYFLMENAEAGNYYIKIWNNNEPLKYTLGVYEIDAADEAGFKFYDVQDKNAFYYNSVYWAAEKGITTGVGNNLFAPDKDVTRAEMVTFLWRTAGSPDPWSYDCPFTDVVPGQYYYKAMLWAVENGITNGVTATTFEPNSICTRAQMVTFLWRNAYAPTPDSYACPFIDVTNQAFYYEAVLWAVENGITNGMTPTTFAPESVCTRGQAVTFLDRASAL